MRRTAVALALVALLLSGCSLGGRTFALMSGSTWRIAPNGTVYALELRPGNEAILYRIDGDAVSEELRDKEAPISIVGFAGSDLVVRTGSGEGSLLRVSADGGSLPFAAADLATVADAPVPSCGPVAGVEDGVTSPAAGCPTRDTAYLFSDTGLLFTVEDGVARLVSPERYRDRSGREGRVVELYALPDRVWVGVITSPAELVHYTALTAPSTP